jgi:hypothetical protein
MNVRAWNQYNINGAGRLIIGQEISAATVTEAFDIAERDAKQWNRRNKKNAANLVNMLSCNGFVRAIS